MIVNVVQNSGDGYEKTQNLCLRRVLRLIWPRSCLTPTITLSNCVLSVRRLPKVLHVDNLTHAEASQRRETMVLRWGADVFWYCFRIFLYLISSHSKSSKAVIPICIRLGPWRKGLRLPRTSCHTKATCASPDSKLLDGLAPKKSLD